MTKLLGDLHQQCLTPPENAAIISALLDVEAKEKKLTGQVVLSQIVVTLLATGIAYYIKGAPQFAIAVLSGGGIAIANGVLLAWRMIQTASHPAHQAHHQLRLLYFYAAERFLVVVALLCICIVVLKLWPLPLLGGFVVGQAVLLAGRFVLSNFRFR